MKLEMLKRIAIPQSLSNFDSTMISVNITFDVENSRGRQVLEAFHEHYGENKT